MNKKMFLVGGIASLLLYAWTTKVLNDISKTQKELEDTKDYIKRRTSELFKI